MSKNKTHKKNKHLWGLITGVKIYRYGAASKDIYATTIHELAHASHWRLDKSAYNDLVYDGFIAPVTNPLAAAFMATKSREAKRVYRVLGNSSRNRTSKTNIS